jgi:hypothetical protein
MLKCHLLHIKILSIYKWIYGVFPSIMPSVPHPSANGISLIYPSISHEPHRCPLSECKCIQKNERYLCSIYLMWVVLLQCAVFNILCNDSINHITFILLQISIQSMGGKCHWIPNARPYIIRGHCLLDWLLLQTNPVLCPSRRMHFDGSIMGLISVLVKQFSIYRS